MALFSQDVDHYPTLTTYGTLPLTAPSMLPDSHGYDAPGQLSRHPQVAQRT
jgi:hypothetical protein